MGASTLSRLKKGKLLSTFIWKGLQWVDGLATYLNVMFYRLSICLVLFLTACSWVSYDLESSSRHGHVVVATQDSGAPSVRIGEIRKFSAQKEFPVWSRSAAGISVTPPTNSNGFFLRPGRYIIAVGCLREPRQVIVDGPNHIRLSVEAGNQYEVDCNPSSQELRFTVSNIQVIQASKG